MELNFAEGEGGIVMPKIFKVQKKRDQCIIFPYLVKHSAEAFSKKHNIFTVPNIFRKPSSKTIYYSLTYLHQQKAR